MAKDKSDKPAQPPAESVEFQPADEAPRSVGSALGDILYVLHSIMPHKPADPEVTMALLRIDAARINILADAGLDVPQTIDPRGHFAYPDPQEEDGE